MSTSFIAVRHNIEVAHRLFLTGGKCQRVHGHSMWVTLRLFGEVNEQGLLEGIDFGTAKQFFRDYLDKTYDHHLLLNKEDPWADGIRLAGQDDVSFIPGLHVFDTDPTTENLARWIGEWAIGNFGVGPVEVEVQETHVNSATWRSRA